MSEIILLGEFLRLSRSILRAFVRNEDFRDAVMGKDALEVGDDLCCGSSAESHNLNVPQIVVNHKQIDCLLLLKQVTRNFLPG